LALKVGQRYNYIPSDPELNLWTAVPKPMIVTHKQYISPGKQSYTVTVKDQNNNPIANALVCVTIPNDQSVYHYGYTDGFGNITFEDINPSAG
jgi:hypothetical protein